MVGLRPSGEDLEKGRSMQLEKCNAQSVYEVLDSLGISYERMEHPPVQTMEDCKAIEKALGAPVCKNLFLRNRQKTEFYLFITAGDKPFCSKDFSRALGVSRVSFAPAERMAAMLGTKIGAATEFSVLLSTAGTVKLIFDNDVLKEDWYGFSDGTTTGYMKIQRRDITDRFLP